MPLILIGGRSTTGCNGKSIAVRAVLCASALFSAVPSSALSPVRNSAPVMTEGGVLHPASFLVAPMLRSLQNAPYQLEFLAGLVLIVALSLLTCYLLYKRKQLTRARREQMRLSGMLINAQEDERIRLASELHDDFSQRLALLSLGIESVAELVPPGCEEAKQQLHELLNSASELGFDLHTLSHRLHSSTLEKLGLVPGVGAFCKEFTAQNQIPVTFSHRDLPRSLSPDVALCLFRVVQEALRNVKKHSGASGATVSLHRVKDYLHLTISDNGTGFDLKDASRRQGIGLLSMEERARLIGARFALYSEPAKGTQVELWAPCTAQTEPEPSVAAAAAGSRA